MSHQFKFHFRKVMLSLSLIALAIAIFPPSASPVLAQNPITARVDRNVIAADEQLVLTVTVSGDFLTIPRPDLSAIEDFVVASSSTSTQVSIVNGKMTSQGVFIYHVQPLVEGKLVINPISVNIGGDVFQTDPLEIEVLPGGTQTTPPQNSTPNDNAPDTTPNILPGRDFFVEAEVNNFSPYLGQQVVYTFRLYQAANLFGQPDYRAPAFTDFWSSEILDQPHYNTQINGRDYLVTEILTALFPANLGQITIAPAQLIIPGGLFNPDIKLESDPVVINVQPLPAGAPVNFSGAVGQFQISAHLSNSESKINDPLTLVIEIEGVGNVETLTEPTLPELEDWRFFESRSASSIRSVQGKMGGTRTFERLVVPGKSGEQLFPAINFSYYDPDIGTYQTINTEPVPVTIHPDDSAQALPLVTDVDSVKQPIELLSSDINHIKSVPYSLSTPRVISVVGRVLYWSAWIFPLFVMGGAFVWKRRQVRLQHDTAYARSLFAQKAALKMLADAHFSGDDGAAAAGRALLGYLSDKLNTPTSGLTTDGLIALLHEFGLEPGMVNRVKDVLLRVDVGRFAPIAADDEQVIIAETRLLIKELEREFGKR